MTRKTSHYEDIEQAALFEWAKYYPILKWMHAIPNGGQRNLREARRLKIQGVKDGVNDIFLPIPIGSHHGLVIEMKRQKTYGKAPVTKKQTEYQEYMTSQGYHCVICYGCNEAIQAIKDYLK